MLKHITVVVGLLIAGCDDGADEPKSYQDMNFEQRVEFMTEVVLPQMKETFVAFDAKYESMTCATCHGGGASDGTYAMPSPDLPRLPATEEAFFEYLEKDPEFARWSQFMADEVWPDMADLLAAEKFDPNTAPNGFSCSNCHMAEGQP